MSPPNLAIEGCICRIGERTRARLSGLLALWYRVKTGPLAGLGTTALKSSYQATSSSY